MSVKRALWEAFTEIPDSKILRDIKNDDHFAYWAKEQNTTREQIAREYIDDRWDNFYRDFMDGAHEDDAYLVVHRCIEVENPALFVERLASKKKRHQKGLGIFWSWNFAKAECHWAAGRGKDIILTGLVDPHAIDIEGTVLANFQPGHGEDENEIRLKEGSTVLVDTISFSDTDPRWNFQVPLRLHA